MTVQDRVILDGGPYVGPRPFTRADADAGRVLFGRDGDVDLLRGLLVSRRLVLLYSPSGAGKTSLIEAKLLPQLRARGLQPLPTIRAGKRTSWRDGEIRDRNRYALQVLASLGADRTDARLSIDEYLDKYEQTEPGRHLLVFDQFEEVLIDDPIDHAAKLAFFSELGESLRNTSRWALFAMREDYLALLEPFLGLLPTRLSTTFRLELLGEAAAREAIVEPARQAGLDVSPVADDLVTQLRTVRIARASSDVPALGLYVEPLQLQVVCLHLWKTEWSQLPPGTTRVEKLNAPRSVHQALREYYRDAVQSAAARAGVSEYVLRRWIERELITPGGMRSEVFADEVGEHTRDLPNAAVEELQNAYLVRGETRRGLTFIEIAHDQLVEPIQSDNRNWIAAHLSETQRRAEEWNRADRPARLLASGSELRGFETWIKMHPDETESLEREYVEASRATVKRRWTRVMVGGILAAVIVALLAVASVYIIQHQIANSISAADAAEAAIQNDPEVSLPKALEAIGTWRTDQAESALREALFQSYLRRTINLPNGERANAAEFSPDGARIVAASTAGARVLQLDQPQHNLFLLSPGPTPGRQTSLEVIQ
ncbi:MAG: hypothetical protein JO057_31900, partial [Chloroflexi bacterium]|nr:hypothetical protein [Chloroflexota bacterium]